MQRPSYIYFDIDDTLLDHRHAEKLALEETCKEFSCLSGVDVLKLGQTYYKINKKLWGEYSFGKVDKETLQRLRFENTLVTLGLPIDEAEDIGRRYLMNYERHWCWISGAQEAYMKLAEMYDVGVLTNGFTEVQKKKITRFEFNNDSRHAIISEEVGYLKPHPKIFEYATQLTGLEPSEILYVGDSYSSDIEGGSNFGWQTAWYVPETNPGENRADIVFSDFRELLEKLS